MAPPKGFRPPAAGMGRKKGSPNRFTVTLKEAILASFDRVGGIDYLEIQARENPQAYMTLLAKVLPMQVTGPNDGPIMLITGVVRAGGDGTIDYEPAPMPAPHPLPQPSPTAALEPATEVPNQDPEPDPLVEMRAVAMTRTGPRFREAPPSPAPTNEGRTVVTESGLRVRSVRPAD